MIEELQKRFIRTTMFVVSIMLVIFFISIISGYAFLNWRSDSEKLSQISTHSFTGGPGDLQWNSAADYGTAPPAPPAPGTVSGQTAGVQETRPDSGGAIENLNGRSLGFYFVVSTDLDGNIIFSDLTHSGDLTLEEMTEVLKIVAADCGVKLAEKQVLPSESEPETEAEIVPQPGAASLSAETVQQPGVAAKLIRRGYIGGYMYECSMRRGNAVDYSFLDLTEEIRSDARLMILLIIICLAGWFLILLLVIFLSMKAIRPIGENLQQQKEFITNAGHEIKTPLAVIVSNVDVQELHTGKSKWLDNIRAQALRLSDLTKQMLTLSRMEEGSSAVFVSTVFDASQQLLDTLKLFTESAALRGIRILTDVTPGILVYVSAEQYRQMLELLFDNAVKYAKENGYISIVL